MMKLLVGMSELVVCLDLMYIRLRTDSMITKECKWLISVDGYENNTKC